MVQELFTIIRLPSGEQTIAFTPPDGWTAPEGFNLDEALFEAIEADLLASTGLSADEFSAAIANGDLIRYDPGFSDAKNPYAAIVGLGYGSLVKNAYSAGGDAICGVFGLASNSYRPIDDAAPSWGGMFYKLLAKGLYLGVRVVQNATTFLNDTDTYVTCYNTQTLYLFLPPKPQNGQVIIIHRMYQSQIMVYGNGHSISQAGFYANNIAGAGWGDKSFYIWDGRYWNYNYMP